MSIVFGPIPSRRLGRSLGINNIPPKICSYSCVYCQVGVTDTMSIQRSEYFSPGEIFEAVSKKVKSVLNAGEKIDYLTIVPDGEPTLDINIGKTIELLESLEIKIAVITNASLLWQKSLRKELKSADWVSVKIDSVYQDIWHKINRPHGRLEFEKIIDGIKLFASEFTGRLVSETMLVRKINDGLESLSKTAEFIQQLNPQKSYILVPTRPPAEKNVSIPNEYSLNLAYQIFNSYLCNPEFLISNEGTNFTFLGELESELLSIMSVHPMRKDAVKEFLNRANSDWTLIQNLVDEKKLKEVKYADQKYYLTNLFKDRNQPSAN